MRDKELLKKVALASNAQQAAFKRESLFRDLLIEMVQQHDNPTPGWNPQQFIARVKMALGETHA